MLDVCSFNLINKSLDCISVISFGHTETKIYGPLLAGKFEGITIASYVKVIWSTNISTELFLLSVWESFFFFFFFFFFFCNFDWKFFAFRMVFFMKTLDMVLVKEWGLKHWRWRRHGKRLLLMGWRGHSSKNSSRISTGWHKYTILFQSHCFWTKVWE